jgi:hypothetical protein
MSAVEFDAAVPELRAPAPVIAWLAAPGAAGVPEAEALEAAGATDGGRLHPRLEDLRETIRDAPVRIGLERGDRIGHGWLGPDRAVLAHPLPDRRARVTALPPALLIDALVRLNDVGPRPRAEPAVRIATAPGPLAAALAHRAPEHVPLADPLQAAAFADLLAGLREHWRVTVAWDPAEGALGARRLEVLDTDGGYWLVIPDDPTVELWPTTPTAVFRALCDLFPLPGEVRAWITS